MNGNTKIPTELNFDKMKSDLIKAGGFFYQYRPCRRNYSTIYDIENIRHDVVYAQTPLNMNDPFDSMIAFSPQKVYENCIEMLIDAIDTDDFTKTIISSLLHHRAFGTLANLISSLKELKVFLLAKRKAMHKTNVPLQLFIAINAKPLYSKLPKALKTVFTYPVYIAFCSLIPRLENVKISEKAITDMLDIDEALNELHAKAQEMRDITYPPLLKEFLSKITISCFSASGWNNQLMWAHYANSYSGICLEYDFSRIKDFIGFIYPVEYTEARPTLSLKDLGVERIDLTENDRMVHCDMDLTQMFHYLLSKNTCWNYEEEWRIINIGEPNTPLFINMPFLSSITLGINMDEICRRLIIELCRIKNIKCYQLVVDKESFTLHRESIDIYALEFNEQDEIDYLNLLFAHFSDLSDVFTQQSEILVNSISEEKYDYNTFHDTFEISIDVLCDMYFIKTGLNHLFYNLDTNIQTDQIPSNIVEIVQGIDSLVQIFTENIKNCRTGIKAFTLNGDISTKQSIHLTNQINNIQELTQRIAQYSWHPALSNFSLTK